MAFWKDKKGEKLTFKQFMLRWVDGMERVTPLQQTRMVLFGYVLIIIGIIAGVIYSIIGEYYWLSAILSGSLIVNFFGFIGTLQKVRLFKQQEEFMRKAKEVAGNEREYVG